MKNRTFVYFKGALSLHKKSYATYTPMYGAWFVQAKTLKKAKGKFIRCGIIPK